LIKLDHDLEKPTPLLVSQQKMFMKEPNFQMLGVHDVLGKDEDRDMETIMDN
jgi:hypothetical protein